MKAREAIININIARRLMSLSILACIAICDSGVVLGQSSSAHGTASVAGTDGLRDLLTGSRQGRPGYRAKLLNKISDATVAELAFFLGSLDQVDAPEVLHALKKTLSDQRLTKKGRRLCDVAVEAFVHRLHLTPTFKLAAGHSYNEAQTSEVRRLIDESIPQS